MRSWRNQGNERNPLFPGKRQQSCPFLKGDVRYNDAVNAGLGTARKESLTSVGKDRIGIGQKYKGDLCLFPYLFKQIEKGINAEARGKSTVIRFLDHRPFRNGITERDSQLNDTGPCFFHGINEGFRRG